MQGCFLGILSSYGNVMRLSLRLVNIAGPFVWVFLKSEYYGLGVPNGPGGLEYPYRTFRDA